MKSSRKIEVQLDELEITIKEIRAELASLDQPVVAKRFTTSPIMESIADLLNAEDELESELYGQGERGALNKRNRAIERLRTLAVITQ